MNRTDDVQRFLPLAPHAFQILLSLLDEVRHPYSILKDVEERTEGEMVLGTSTVYSAIKRMLLDGLLREAEEPTDEASGGPRRRYYGITPLGREVARAEGHRIARLHRMVRESALLAEGRGASPRRAES